MMDLSAITIKKYNDGMTGPEIITNARVEEAIRTLAQIKRKEEALAEAKAQCQIIIAEFHFTTGAREMAIDGVGSITAYLGSQKRFDKDKAKMALVEKGVSAVLVGKVWDAATQTKFNDNVTVKFTPAK
jgi:hypothetical protein